MKKLLKRMILITYKIFTVLFPVKKNMILFESNLGRNYTGSPKAIYEEMVARGLDKVYKCVWILEDTGINIKGKSKKIKRNRMLYFYYMAIMKILVCDCRQPIYIIKRTQAVFIQTWHGTPLKKLALDMDEVYMVGETDIETYKKNFKKDSSRWDYLLSQNAFSTGIFKKAFAFDKEILEIGYPRNDILINNNNSDYIEKIKINLGISLEKKVILYAPTWRDNEFYKNGEYKFCSKLDFDLLKKELSEEYVIIVKYHYLVVETIDWKKYEGFIYDCDMNYDISLLYLVSNLLITDYSSVMFDYSLLNRPILFFAYDLENYKNNLRGFYFDFEKEAPGPISQNTKELIKDIKYYSFEKFEKPYKEFKQKYNHADNGSASKILIKLIQAKLKGD